MRVPVDSAEMLLRAVPVVGDFRVALKVREPPPDRQESSAKKRSALHYVVRPLLNQADDVVLYGVKLSNASYGGLGARISKHLVANGRARLRLKRENEVVFGYEDFWLDEAPHDGDWKCAVLYMPDAFSFGTLFTATETPGIVTNVQASMGSAAFNECKAHVSLHPKSTLLVLLGIQSIQVFSGREAIKSRIAEAIAHCDYPWETRFNRPALSEQEITEARKLGREEAEKFIARVPNSRRLGDQST